MTEEPEQLMPTDASPETREFAAISPAQIDALRAMIGHPIRSDRPHVTELTADAIRHYAYGIGDRNPLWVDPGYAAAHGRTQLAPPSALLAMNKVFSGYVTGLPGIHAMYAGATFDFTLGSAAQRSADRPGGAKGPHRAAEPIRRALLATDL